MAFVTTARRERGAQRAVGLDAGGRELVRCDRTVGADATLLGNAREDGQAVERTQLVLAAQPRVEDLSREGAAETECQAGNDPRDDAELGLRPGRLGRLVGPRVELDGGVRS